MIKTARLSLIILLLFASILTGCSVADCSDADYTDIEIHMTYSEVVAILGEHDNIYDTYPGYPYNTKYYVWNFDDGNKLYVHLGYPGVYGEGPKPKYPDDYVVHYYYVVNESLLPTTLPSITPTE